MSKNVGLINCPINKNLLKKSNMGLTEFLHQNVKLKKILR